ncbi:MAG: hypothetical protein Q9O74_12155 [Planctomycetota bacterium]|nr:hypothetical protein [Planctomycetota bacterium]
MKRLETKRASGACPGCAGLGCVSLVNERNGQRREDAKGCRLCGRVSKLILLEANHG